MSLDPAQLETKLAAARARLILDKPFLGALTLRLPMVPAKKDWCPTTATDARTFYYNPEYIGALSLPETQFVLAHEALHCALSHFARRQHRIKHKWDLACDLAINPLLIDDGLKPPPNSLLVEAYRGMTAEEIYPLIEDSDQSKTLDEHVYDSESEGGSSGNQPAPPRQQETRSERGNESGNEGQGARPEPGQEGQQGASSGQEMAPEGGEPADRPSALTPDERETLSIQWQQRLAGAAQQALQAGKLSASLARLIDHLLQPQLPWRMLLARHLSLAARDDFSYMRPSRREGAAILPSLRSAQIAVVVAVDTSGSIKPQEMDEFFAEVNALKAQVRARLALLACDERLADGAPWIVEPWEELEPPASVGGGGGTDFRPVFDWVARQDHRPELLVYFTDAEGEFPAAEPDYPVLWLVKGRAPVPWGQRIQLN
jgi:predicted metal-dependent peptidase